MQSDGDDEGHAVGGAEAGVDPQEGAKGARNYAFTVFEPFPTLDLLDEAFEEVKTSYIIMGNEVCPTTQKKHLQCFVSFHNKIKWDTVKIIYPWGRNVKACYKPALANYRYCSKDGNVYYEKGGRPTGMGKRTDLDDARELLLDGKSDREYALSVTSWQAINSHKRLKMMLLPPPPELLLDKQVIYIWGPPGANKSRTAREIVQAAYPGLRPYMKPPGKWFCNYQGQPAMIIDDIRPKQLDFEILLAITDVYNTNQEYKGGMVDINIPLIVITAPFSQDELYAGLVHENMQQFTRRITRVIHLTGATQ